AVASLAQARAAEGQAKSALQSAIDVVPGIQAQLEEAEFNLQQCVVRAPADGYVTDWAITEGTMTSTFRAGALGVYVDTSNLFVIAVYPQNLLPNVKAGDTVEVAFLGAPGQVFNGNVETVIEATGEGQPKPTGTLPSAASIGSKGDLAVKIRLL